MAKKRHGKRVFQRVTLDRIRTLNNLIPPRTESIPARSDKLVRAVLQMIFGPDWMDRHINLNDKPGARPGFLQCDAGTPGLREARRMRRVVFTEMLHNLWIVKGFHSCLVELAGGQIESTYGALEIARMLATTATDKGMTFRFMPRSGIKKRDYDLSITFSDGVRVCAETKCKLEETAISLRTIEESLSQAKSQLPARVPGIVFIKVPRYWIEDETFAAEMHRLAERFLARSPSIVSVKYYTVRIVSERDRFGGEGIGEVVTFREHTNDKHKFRKYKDRNWHMFPTTEPVVAPPLHMTYNGLPSTWQRLFVTPERLFAGAKGL